MFCDSVVVNHVRHVIRSGIQMGHIDIWSLLLCCDFIMNLYSNFSPFNLVMNFFLLCSSFCFGAIGRQDISSYMVTCNNHFRGLCNSYGMKYYLYVHIGLLRINFIVIVIVIEMVEREDKWTLWLQYSIDWENKMLSHDNLSWLKASYI